MALDGKIYPTDDPVGGYVRFEDVDYISFVSNSTYGKPPIIAPGTDDFTSAQELGREITVLYVNPANITALEVTKDAGE